MPLLPETSGSALRECIDSMLQLRLRLTKREFLKCGAERMLFNCIRHPADDMTLHAGVTRALGRLGRRPRKEEGSS